MVQKLTDVVLVSNLLTINESYPNDCDGDDTDVTLLTNGVPQLVRLN